jgi:GNAT superfamily N-acetyltransferase
VTSTNFHVRIRPVRAGDREYVLALVPRLMEFGPPPYRERAQMTAKDVEVIAKAIDSLPEGSELLVAEDSDGGLLGFIYLITIRDYFTHEEHGHVSDIAVAPEAEGRGVGRALLAAAEEWSLAHGYRLLDLNAFVENKRARAVYEKMGYKEEMVKYVKILRD